jgi:hypothetical protein
MIDPHSMGTPHPAHKFARQCVTTLMILGAPLVASDALEVAKIAKPTVETSMRAAVMMKARQEAGSEQGGDRGGW